MGSRLTIINPALNMGPVQTLFSPRRLSVGVLVLAHGSGSRAVVNLIASHDAWRILLGDTNTAVVSQSSISI